ncbi:MAG: hypothetical protein ABIP20_14340 [Chthoniobacteraceae bacterium]
MPAGLNTISSTFKAAGYRTSLIGKSHCGTVKNNAATHWYHPHAHEATQKQITMGTGGLLHINVAAPTAQRITTLPDMLTKNHFPTEAEVTARWGDGERSIRAAPAGICLRQKNTST